MCCQTLNDNYSGTGVVQATPGNIIGTSLGLFTPQENEVSQLSSSSNKSSWKKSKKAKAGKKKKPRKKETPYSRRNSRDQLIEDEEEKEEEEEEIERKVDKLVLFGSEDEVEDEDLIPEVTSFETGSF